MKDSHSHIVSVPLTQIDVQDRTFEYRLASNLNALQKSIAERGQQVPVILRGEKPPYQIVCGFRRTRAIEQLGRESVLAVIKPDLIEEDAYALSYLENAERRNLTPLDRANAIWRAYALGRVGTQAEVAKLFGLTTRQVQNYIEMTRFSDQLKDAILQGKITSGHALLLHRYSRIQPEINITRWIERIRNDGISVQALKSQLKRLVRKSKAPRPPEYLRTRGDSVIFSGFRFHPQRTAPEEKERIVASLEKAIQLLKGIAT